MSAVLPANSTALPASNRVGAASDGQPDRVVGAIERLALSREQLRITMMPAVRKSSSHAGGAGVGTFASGLVDRIRDMPGATLVFEALQTWWQQHPLRTAGLVAADASRKFATPLAERNPLGLMLGAVAVGALLALSKPWRWLLRPALFAGIVPAIAARVMRQLPIESWLRMFAHVSARTAREEVSGVPPASPVPEPTTRPAATSQPPSIEARRPAGVPSGAPATQSPPPASYSYGDSAHASVP